MREPFAVGFFVPYLVLYFVEDGRFVVGSPPFLLFLGAELADVQPNFLNKFISFGGFVVAAGQYDFFNHFRELV